jgi:hypothetical protein
MHIVKKTKRLNKIFFPLFLGLAKPLFGWHSTGVPAQVKILLLDTAQITLGVNKTQHRQASICYRGKLASSDERADNVCFFQTLFYDMGSCIKGTVS